MRVYTAFLAFLALCATLGLVMAQDRPAREPALAPRVGVQTTASREREPDVRALTDLLASFVKAYNEKDAKALAPCSHRTPRSRTRTARSRGAATLSLAGSRGFSRKAAETGSPWRQTPCGSWEPILPSRRGRRPSRLVPENLPDTNRYSVIYARQGGRWLHARIRDEQPDEVSPHEQLLQLEWMLGEWVNESDDGIVKTNCKWSDDGNFLLREFDVKVEGRIALRGTQRIGWDAQRKQFRTWVFDDRGGFAEGLLSRDGDRWITRASGVRSDGQSVSTTNAFTALGKDRILWETLERTVAGEAVPGTDQFYLVRPAPLPGK